MKPNLFDIIKMGLLAVMIFLQSSILNGQNNLEIDFLPNGYLAERYLKDVPAASKNIKVTDIQLGGVGYMKLQHQRGTLYIEKVTRPDVDPKIKLDCNGLENPVQTQEQRITTEKEITDDFSIDITIVNSIFITRCDGEIKAVTTAIDPLELGVKIKNKKGQPFKIFNRMLKPNIGFQTEF